MQDWRDSISRFEHWYRRDALPLWLQHGYDDACGGFYETLDFSGSGVSGQPRRVRVQARQIHTFTQSAIRGWAPEGEALAAKGFDYVLANACPDGGARGCVHLLSDSGAILDDRRDLYDQAFLLLACASRWEAAQDRRALTLAERTVSFLDRELASPHGGWMESDQYEMPRRQNPHMHLFEAFMALYDATGDDSYQDYATSIHGLFNRHFFDASKGILREFFDEKLVVLDSAKGKIIEPGHMMEWVWLLGKFNHLFGKGDQSTMRILYERAKVIGANRAGFLSDTVTLDTPSVDSPSRLWPQTEFIKAATTLARYGDETTTDIGWIIDRIMNTYLKVPVSGLWCDQYGADGKPLAHDVPSSILYHLFEAISDVVDVVSATEEP